MTASDDEALQISSETRPRKRIFEADDNEIEADLIGFQKMPRVSLERADITPFLRGKVSRKNASSTGIPKRQTQPLDKFSLKCSVVLIRDDLQAKRRLLLKRVDGPDIPSSSVLDFQSSLKEKLEVKRPKKRVSFSDKVTIIELKEYHKCKKCPRIFDTLKLLRTHTKKKHKKNRQYICNYCRKSFHDRTIFKVHIKLHCNTCGLLFESRAKLLVHKNTVCQTMHECKVCHLKFFKRKHLEDHSYDHTVSSFVCNSCHESFPTKCAIAHHIAYLHSKRRPKSLYEVRSLGADRLFLCNFCDETSVDRDMIDDHVQDLPDLSNRVMVGQSYFYLCTQCTEIFPTEKQMLDHKWTHFLKIDEENRDPKTVEADYLSDSDSESLLPGPEEVQNCDEPQTISETRSAESLEQPKDASDTDFLSDCVLNLDPKPVEADSLSDTDSESLLPGPEEVQKCDEPQTISETGSAESLEQPKIASDTESLSDCVLNLDPKTADADSLSDSDSESLLPGPEEVQKCDEPQTISETRSAESLEQPKIASDTDSLSDCVLNLDPKTADADSLSDSDSESLLPGPGEVQKSDEPNTNSNCLLKALLQADTQPPRHSKATDNESNASESSKPDNSQNSDLKSTYKVDEVPQQMLPRVVLERIDVKAVLTMSTSKQNVPYENHETAAKNKELKKAAAIKKPRMLISQHQCSTCSRYFSSAYGLKRHVENMHRNLESLQCRVCEEVFVWPSLLYSHKCIRLNQPELPFRDARPEIHFDNLDQVSGHDSVVLTDVVTDIPVDFEVPASVVEVCVDPAELGTSLIQNGDASFAQMPTVQSASDFVQAGRAGNTVQTVNDIVQTPLGSNSVQNNLFAAAKLANGRLETPQVFNSLRQNPNMANSVLRNLLVQNSRKPTLDAKDDLTQRPATDKTNKVVKNVRRHTLDSAHSRTGQNSLPTGIGQNRANAIPQNGFVQNKNVITNSSLAQLQSLGYKVVMQEVPIEF